MEVSIVRQEKSKLEEEIAQLIYNFEHKTGEMVSILHIYRQPMYTGHSDNLGAVTVQAEVRI